MKPFKYLLLPVIFLLSLSCITQFLPDTDEDPNLLVVEGLITDQPEVNTVKLSKSMPLGKMSVVKPLTGCNVSIMDDLGHTYMLTESSAGTYITNISEFQGIVGRTYTLLINTNNSTQKHFSYQSKPVQMKSVPRIDSLFYEKVVINEKTEYSGPQEGCQVYINTHDDSRLCKYYRWDYIETWKFILPYYVPNQTCWIANSSDAINIKNTTVFSEDRISRYPLKFISNETDRLDVRYSILVNQYSLDEEEYSYWEKLQTISEKIGGLYDIVPSSIPGNIYCIEDPKEQVLGYFSVSAKSSKRIYIDETFRGLVNLYRECPADTIFGNAPIEGLNSVVWVIVEEPLPVHFRITTYQKGCADCTVRGTTVRPDFWTDY